MIKDVCSKTAPLTFSPGLPVFRLSLDLHRRPPLRPQRGRRHLRLFPIRRNRSHQPRPRPPDRQEQRFRLHLLRGPEEHSPGGRQPQWGQGEHYLKDMAHQILALENRQENLGQD